IPDQDRPENQPRRELNRVQSRFFSTLLVPSQMDERWDKLELAATDMVAVLKAELAALRIWQSARNPRSGPALPDDVWDGMTISIDKIEGVLRKAGIDDPVNARNLGQRRNEE